MTPCEGTAETMTFRTLAAFAAAMILAALCAAPASAADYKCKDADGNWSEAACTGSAAPPPKVALGSIDWIRWKPAIGMKQADVQALIDRGKQERRKFSFAEQEAGKGPPYNPWLDGPNRVTRTQTATGEREKWIYHDGYSERSLEFTDGMLTRIQDSMP